jgi:hypothetical protein
VLCCPCGGRHRIVSDVQDREAVVAILRHLGRGRPRGGRRRRAPRPSQDGAVTPELPAIFFVTSGLERPHGYGTWSSEEPP